MKDKLLTAGYWLWSWTWGVIMTAIGAVIALGLLVTGHKPHIFHYNVYFQFGRGWGGVNFGAFFFLSETMAEQDKQHEAGHGLQNLVFGVFMPFVVGLPSAIRCLIRGYNQNTKKLISGLITGIAAAVGVAVSLAGFICGITWLGVIGLLFTVYALGMAWWLFGKEIPQYENGAHVDYDAVWFEGSATRLGEKYFPL